mgnify:FL=1
MPQSKDPVLVRMQHTAVSKHVYDDLPAHLALLASLDFWMKRDDNPNLCNTFVQLVLNPANFAIPFDELAETCCYCEKSLRIYACIFARKFSDFLAYFSSLPLLFQIMRCIEFYFNTTLAKFLYEWRDSFFDDISVAISASSASTNEINLTNQIIQYFTVPSLQNVI